MTEGGDVMQTGRMDSRSRMEGESSIPPVPDDVVRARFELLLSADSASAHDDGAGSGRWVPDSPKEGDDERVTAEALLQVVPVFALPVMPALVGESALSVDSLKSGLPGPDRPGLRSNGPGLEVAALPLFLTASSSPAVHSDGEDVIVNSMPVQKAAPSEPSQPRPRQGDSQQANVMPGAGPALQPLFAAPVPFLRQEAQSVTPDPGVQGRASLTPLPESTSTMSEVIVAHRPSRLDQEEDGPEMIDKPGLPVTVTDVVEQVTRHPSNQAEDEGDAPAQEAVSEPGSELRTAKAGMSWPGPSPTAAADGARVQTSPAGADVVLSGKNQTLPPGVLSDWLQQAVSALQVGEGVGGVQQVRLDIKPELIPGVRVILQEVGGRVQVDFICSVEASRQRLGAVAQREATEIARRCRREMVLRVLTETEDGDLLSPAGLIEVVGRT